MQTHMLYHIWIEPVSLYKAPFETKHMCDVSDLNPVCFVPRSTPETNTHVWCIISESSRLFYKKQTWNKNTCMIYHIWLRFALLYKDHTWCNTHMNDVSHLNRAVCFTKHTWNKHTCMIYHIWLRFVLLYKERTWYKTHVWCITSESSCVVLPSTPQRKTSVWCMMCSKSENEFVLFHKEHTWCKHTCTSYHVWIEPVSLYNAPFETKHMCDVSDLNPVSFVPRSAPETKTHVWCITHIWIELFV
jgi:hypothetical protein